MHPLVLHIGISHEPSKKEANGRRFAAARQDCFWLIDAKNAESAWPGGAASMSAGLVLLVSGLFSQAAAEVEKEPALFALAQEGNGAFWKPRIQWERETPQTPACLVAQAGQVWFQFDPERQKASQAVTARAEETAALVKAFSRHLGEFFGSRAIPFLAGDDEPADPEQAQRWARWRDQWMDRYAARDDGDILPWRHDAHPLREGLRQLEVEILKSMVDEGRSASQGQELKSESTPDSITKKTTSRL